MGKSSGDLLESWPGDPIRSEAGLLTMGGEIKMDNLAYDIANLIDTRISIWFGYGRYGSRK